VAAGAGHYESFYIKASRPGGGQSIWIRHTVHQRPGSERTAALWVTFFDRHASGPVATKQTVPAAELSAPSDAYIQVGEALLEPGRARGSAHSDALSASWDLTFTDGAEQFHHLPYERLYRTKLPRTKFLSPYPASLFSGGFQIGDTTVALDGWHGMIGHNWGAEHAERWVWIQAPNLNGNEGDYVDIAAGRIKIGRFTTPWVANGQIVLDGELYRLGGFDRIYGTDLDEQPASCEFTFPGRGVNAKGRVSAAQKDVVGWIYADPKGPEHNTLNCSIADLKLKVERAGERHAHIEVEGATAYEFGTRDTEHGIALQPYPDG
jgi:hypothetical protein